MGRIKYPSRTKPKKTKEEMGSKRRKKGLTRKDTEIEKYRGVGKTRDIAKSRRLAKWANGGNSQEIVIMN